MRHVEATMEAMMEALITAIMEATITDGLVPNGVLEMERLKIKNIKFTNDNLSIFMQKMMHFYQIENVIAFISGVKNNQDPGITKKALNPLGEFNGLKSVSNFASDDFVSLF